MSYRPAFCPRCARRLGSVPDHDRQLGALAGRRRLGCRACRWMFYDNPVPSVVALVQSRGRVLLGRRARPPGRGRWGLPGGFMEGTEGPLAALARELREELGVGIARSRLLEVAMDRYGRHGFPTLAFVYRVTLAPGRLQAADDVVELRWFPRDRLPLGEIAFPSIRSVLIRHVAREVAELTAGEVPEPTARLGAARSLPNNTSLVSRPQPGSPI